MVIKRGDIFYADLRPVVGSEQGGIRPVLIIQNNVGNRHSPTAVSYTHLDVYKRQPGSCLVDEVTVVGNIEYCSSVTVQCLFKNLF